MAVREVPIEIWQTVDGCLDNLAAVERIGGDESVVTWSERLRKLGWDAAAAHPGPAGANGWPLSADQLSLDLSASDVRFIVETLDRSKAVTLTLLGNPEPSIRQQQQESLHLDEQALRFWKGRAAREE
ncbi:hypothetical protein [uncultured Microbacterium sp.]|uniref:hypothetical protein n=1 Tax=uncultured Microbacterium sp. TaxID=191216 RepID=UPI0026255D67|nr:hypothetical protein [uncultured Microbacterium sp.]